MIFCTGLAVLLIGQLIGIWVDNRISEMGIPVFINEHMTSFRMYYLSYPLGILLAVIGVLYHRADMSRVWLFAAGGVIALIIYDRAHVVAGAYPNSLFFAVGGTLITLILLGIIWYWAKYRAGVEKPALIAADLQMAGYIFFAFAAWSTCGIGGMPCYALYPEKMITLQTLPVLFSLLSKIMVFFVLGWFFLLLSHLSVTRVARK